jgi:hypothetical protein
MKDRKIEKIEIILPPVASSDREMDLVNLTEYLSKKLKLDTSFGLGGEYGYGVDYENDTFMMKPYCWCEQEDSCLWCMMNDPKENKNYDKMKKEITKRFGKECADWGGAPQFYYKPTKFWIRWYKWIGRDNEYGKKISDKEWRKMIEKCIKSILPQKGS